MTKMFFQYEDFASYYNPAKFRLNIFYREGVTSKNRYFVI